MQSIRPDVSSVKGGCSSSCSKQRQQQTLQRSVAKLAWDGAVHLWDIQRSIQQAKDEEGTVQEEEKQQAKDEEGTVQEEEKQAKDEEGTVQEEEKQQAKDEEGIVQEETEKQRVKDEEATVPKEKKKTK